MRFKHSMPLHTLYSLCDDYVFCVCVINTCVLHDAFTMMCGGPCVLTTHYLIFKDVKYLMFKPQIVHATTTVVIPTTQYTISMVGQAVCLHNVCV